MNKDLNSLLWKHHWKLLSLFFVTVVGIYLYNGLNQVNSWNENYQSTIEQIKLSEGTETIKDYDFSLFYTPGQSSNKIFTTFINEPSHILWIAIALLSFGLFFLDKFSDFDQFLFASRFSKKMIFSTKMIFGFSTLLGSLIIGKIIFIGLLYMRIPNEFFNATFFELLPNQLLSLLFYSLIFSMMMFFAIIIGDVFFLFFVSIGFSISIGFFMNTFRTLFDKWNYYQHGSISMIASNSWVFSLFKAPGIQGEHPPIWYYLVYSVGTGLLVALSSHYYKKLSLENNGKFILFSTLNKPLILIVSLYVPFMLVSNWLYADFYNLQLTRFFWLNHLLSFGFGVAFCGSLSWFLLFKKEALKKRSF